jgi:hypothetical protein
MRRPSKRWDDGNSDNSAIRQPIDAFTSRKRSESRHPGQRSLNHPKKILLLRGDDSRARLIRLGRLDLLERVRLDFQFPPEDAKLLEVPGDGIRALLLAQAYRLEPLNVLDRDVGRAMQTRESRFQYPDHVPVGLV